MMQIRRQITISLVSVKKGGGPSLGHSSFEVPVMAHPSINAYTRYFELPLYSQHLKCLQDPGNIKHGGYLLINVNAGTVSLPLVLTVLIAAAHENRPREHAFTRCALYRAGVYTTQRRRWHSVGNRPKLGQAQCAIFKRGAIRAQGTQNAWWAITGGWAITGTFTLIVNFLQFYELQL